MIAVMECPDCGLEAVIHVLDMIESAEGDVEIVDYECIAGCHGEFTALIEPSAAFEQPVALAS